MFDRVLRQSVPLGTCLVFLALLATLVCSCQAGNLGLYLYPQAADRSISVVSAPDPLGGLEVVGYLPSWKIDAVDPSQIRHLTDLVYFSMTVTSKGELATQGLSVAHLDFLRQMKRLYGVRLILGITDHRTTGALSKVVSSGMLRLHLAKTLGAFLVDKGFDGADLDWEFPTAAQIPDYEALLADLKAEFVDDGLRLSVALSPSHPLTKAGYDSVDRIHGMMYDDEGKHATLGHIVQHVQTMLREGVDPAKLQLGLPFYGRGYTSKGPRWSDAVSYKTLQQKFSPKPGQDTISGYYFNGIETIQQKVRYAKLAGLSGVMIWEIGQDTTDSSSLLAAITATRRGLATPN